MAQALSLFHQEFKAQSCEEESITKLCIFTAGKEFLESWNGFCFSFFLLFFFFFSFCMWMRLMSKHMTIWVLLGFQVEAATLQTSSLTSALKSEKDCAQFLGVKRTITPRLEETKYGFGVKRAIREFLRLFLKCFLMRRFQHLLSRVSWKWDLWRRCWSLSFDQTTDELLDWDPQHAVRVGVSFPTRAGCSFSFSSHLYVCIYIHNNIYIYIYKVLTWHGVLCCKNRVWVAELAVRIWL